MAQGLAMEWIIRPAVFELFLQAAADLDAIFGRDGYITAVKEAMEIAPKQEAVVHSMWAALVERLDVGCFECGERMLFCYRADTVVGIGH